MSIALQRRLRLAVVTLAVVAAACGPLLKRPAKDPLPPITLLAVLPIERSESAPQPKAVDVEVAPPVLAPNAERVVTAQIYGVMAEVPTWHYVPDLVVEQAWRELPASDTLEARALHLGTALKADGVLYGTVSRFREREGGEFGARQPASVSFRLALLTVSTGQTVWQGDFDRTQKPLTSNLFDWWMFWRAGPHWFTGSELARLGVEQLLGDLQQRLE